MARYQKNDAEFQAKLALAVERGMTRAVLLVKNKVVDSISTGQPVRRSGKSLIGLDPSKPGEPPHVLQGRLRQSIAHQVSVEGAEIVGKVGTNIEYGRRLELGMHGTDSLGRTVNQEARPYLRPAITGNRRAILRELVKE